MAQFRLRLARTVCRLLPPLFAQRTRNVIYPPALALQDCFECVARSQTSSHLQVSTGDDHGYVFAVHGYYDWRNLALALALCKPGDTVVEVGANIGTETIGFADIVGEHGKVFAFEPLPSNLVALQDGITRNRLSERVTVFRAAVSDSCGVARFQAPQNTHESGMGHLAASGTGLEVVCVTLDSMADQVGSARMIYVDVEGFEVQVLRGAQHYIRTHQPVVGYFGFDRSVRRVPYLRYAKAG